MSASKTLKKNLSIAVAAVFLAVAAFACGAFEPAKAYADTTDSHLTVASEVHVLVDGEGNVTIPNATVTNDGTCAAYIMGCSAPDGLEWTCDAVGKRIEAGQSISATWRSAGPVSAEIAAQLGEEPYYAGNLTYTYTDGDLKGTVSLDNTDPTVGDTITATVSGANVPDDKLTYQWVKVKDGSETSIDGATGPTYTATDDDAGYELVCKVSSTDDIYQGTISGNTGAVKKVQAFAVYSADDGSLNFYKRAGMPNAGEQFNGKTATAVYTGIETDTYNQQSAVPWYANRSDIKTASVVDDGIQPVSTSRWFYGCSNMTQCDVSKLDTSKVTSMYGMFDSCESLTTLGDLSGWKTNKVTDMGFMFDSCKSLTTLGDLSGWDTSKVNYMSNMFSSCSSLTTLGDLSNWDTSNVGVMYMTFSSCSSLTTLGDLSKWDTSQVYNMDSLFINCKSLTTLGDLSNWDTSKVTTMRQMFASCKSLTSLDLSNWDTSNVTNMDTMFASCKSLTTLGDLSGWKTNKVTDMSEMFTFCESLTTLGDLSKWDTSKVTTMRLMFQNCSSLTSLDLSNWDTSNVTNTVQMFYNCFKLQEITLGDKWQWVSPDGYLPTPDNPSGLWYAESNGEGYAPNNIPSSKTDTYSVIPVDGYAFAVYCEDDKSLNFYKRKTIPSSGSQFEGRKVTVAFTGIENISSYPQWSGIADSLKSISVVDNGIKPTATIGWFAGCNSLTSFDISKLDTSRTTDMSNMFSGSNLSSLDLSNWDVSKVKRMYFMFAGCSSLTTVGDLSNWNVSNATNMNTMFAGCSKLTVDCSNWNVANVTDHNSFNAAAPGVTLPRAWQASASADTSVSNAVVLNAPGDEQRDDGSNVDTGDGDAGNDVDEKLDDSGKEEGLQGSADSNDTVAIGGAKQETGSGQEVYIAA